jgi:hypothetical protein
VVGALTEDVTIAKVCVVAPVGIVTLVGTDVFGLLLAIATVASDVSTVGIVNVPVAASPPITVSGATSSASVDGACILNVVERVCWFSVAVSVTVSSDETVSVWPATRAVISPAGTLTWLANCAFAEEHESVIGRSAPVSFGPSSVSTTLTLVPPNTPDGVTIMLAKPTGVIERFILLADPA